jgi:hypothetical protein
VTFEQWARKELVANGMFESQADAVLSAVKADSDNKAMDRWTDDIEGYPSSMLAVVWLMVSTTALAWIDANMPRAWYRPMFLPEAERKALLGI